MCEYKMEYVLPTEAQLVKLPQTALKTIGDKNGVKTYGSKKTLIERLLKYWQSHSIIYIWSSSSDPRDTLEKVTVTSRGRVQSSFSLLMLTTELGSEVYLPVLGQDYQEE